MSIQQRLKSGHLRLTGNHIITTMARLPMPMTRLAAGFIWGERIWRQYLIPQTPCGQELLFIHIPKCAGTSVARLFEGSGYDHFPAYAFHLTQAERFQSAVSFTVIRDPAERLASILTHFRGSKFATPQEREIADRLALGESTLDSLVQRLVTDRKFEKYLFGDTQSGQAGFNVAQSDWIYWKDRLLVNRVYALSHLESLVEWLSDLTQTHLVMPHANRSTKKQSRFVPTDATAKAVEKRYPRDAELWAKLQDCHGVLIANA